MAKQRAEEGNRLPPCQRMARVAAETLRHTPDVVTMQEVDCLEELMEDHGLDLFYDGVKHLKRGRKVEDWELPLSQARTDGKKNLPGDGGPKDDLNSQAWKDSGFTDGVAILWRKEKYIKVGPKRIILLNTLPGCLNAKCQYRKTPEDPDDEAKAQGTRCLIHNCSGVHNDKAGKAQQVWTDKGLKFPHCLCGKLWHGVNPVDDNRDVRESGQRAIYVVLQCKKTGQEFIVMTAHMKSGEKTDDMRIKKEHSKIMAKKIEQLEKVGKCRDANCRGRDRPPSPQNKCIECGNDFVIRPVIYAADFNTNPCTAAFKKFTGITHDIMTSAYGHNDHQDRGANGKLKSVYTNTTPATSFKSRKGGNQFAKCQPIKQAIDFIFYSNQWKCNATLSLVELMMLAKEFGLPNWKYPSDHVMIMADLELCPQQPVMRRDGNTSGPPRLARHQSRLGHEAIGNINLARDLKERRVRQTDMAQRDHEDMILRAREMPSVHVSQRYTVGQEVELDGRKHPEFADNYAIVCGVKKIQGRFLYFLVYNEMRRLIENIEQDDIVVESARPATLQTKQQLDDLRAVEDLERFFKKYQ